MRLVFTIACLLMSYIVYAQDSLTIEQIVEDVITQVGEETDFDFNTLLERFEGYAQKPINLNTATQEDLFEFLLLSPAQINALINYRTSIGELSAFEELQAIPLFDIQTIEKIKRFETLTLLLSCLYQTQNYGNFRISLP